MEKSSVEGQNRHLCTAGELQWHARGIIRTQPARLQFLRPEIPNLLTEPVQLANEYSIYSSRTVVDNFIKIGGDEPMGL